MSEDLGFAVFMLLAPSPSPLPSPTLLPSLVPSPSLSPSPLPSSISEADITKILIGAILAFVFAVLLQVVVMPLVQAHTRRRERWERSVSELSALLEDELPRVLKTYRHLAAVERGVIAKLIQEGMPSDEIDQFTQELWEPRREAAEALDGPMRRLVILSDHLRTRKPRRVDWVTMYLLVEDLRYKVSMMTGLPNPRVDERKIFHQNERKVDEARSALIENIKPIRDLMRLPRPVLDPLWRQVRRPLVRLLWPAVLFRGRFAKWLAGVESRRDERRRQRLARGTIPTQHDRAADTPAAREPADPPQP